MNAIRKQHYSHSWQSEGVLIRAGGLGGLAEAGQVQADEVKHHQGAAGGHQLIKILFCGLGNTFDLCNKMVFSVTTPPLGSDMTMIIGASVRRSSSRRSGGRLLAMTQWPLFSFFFFSPFFLFLLRRDLFSQKECSDQKTYFAKVDGNAQKPRGRHLSRPPLPFWGPLAAILDFAGIAGGQRAPPSPLGWYFFQNHAKPSKNNFEPQPKSP